MNRERVEAFTGQPIRCSVNTEHRTCQGRRAMCQACAENKVSAETQRDLWDVSSVLSP